MLFLKKIVLYCLVLVFVFTNTSILDAQDGGVVSSRRAQLEKDLEQIEAEISVQQVVLEEKKEERVSIERDVSILEAKIEKARLSIRARNLDIQGLTGDITDKEMVIVRLDERLGREKESLAQLIRKTNEIDNFSIIEVMLSSKNLSHFFEDIDSFDSIQIALQDSFVEITDTKDITRQQKKSLEDKKVEEVELRFIQELQKKKIEVQEGEKQDILKVTKGIEKAYQSIIQSKKKTAAQIRTDLFTLRGSAAIPFERALQYANEASAYTGVRPAFILGVIKNESNLGENVGQCLLTNKPKKGDGKGVNTGRIFYGLMKPDRDVPIFIDVVERLGLDPYKMVVSCAPSYGYGGAMGPAQFIPSTWILYEDRVAKAVGQTPPSPWDARTAFMASAILLDDNGASKKTATCKLTNNPEKCAALRYFAGWKNANNPRYSFYGDSVMDLAAEMQGLINILENN